MKNIQQLYKPIKPFIIFLVLLASCEEVLNLNETPRDRVIGDEVFQDEAYAEALAADLYAEFPFTGFTGFATSIGHHDLGTERGSNFESCKTHGGMRVDSDCDGLWDYEYIRDLNFFIENIRESQLSEDFKTRLEGEARVLRAAVYYKMQKRYGGLIEIQNLFTGSQ